jgi:NAD(P)-dependent dehydrogenase (short-subunit alcohol dehydrogenase family)
MTHTMLSSAPASGAPLGGKTVLVTGASRGIGAACASACAGAGAGHVALVARTALRLEAVAREIRTAGTSVGFHVCDVTDTAALRRLIFSMERLDVLVNCAGANRPEPFLVVEPATFDSLFALNIRAAFFASQAAARVMSGSGRDGVIVNISSQMGHVGAPLRSVYCATKHAIEGLTKALAVELAPHRIRVVSIAPTFVHTDMTARQLDDSETGPALLKQIPIGRWATVEDVAAAVVFAASAPSITGSSLLLDGGWTAQ